jgi:hypothetical protein
MWWLRSDTVDNDEAFGVNKGGSIVLSSRLCYNDSTSVPNVLLSRLEKRMPEFLSLRQALEEDLLPIPVPGKFIRYEDLGTIGHNGAGGLVIQDEDGLLVIDTGSGMDEDIKEILHELASTYRADAQKFV